MKKTFAFAVAMFAVFGAESAFAQTTASASVGGTVEQSLFISLQNSSVTFANSNAADFNAGYKQVTGGNLIHKGNVVHTVSVKADAASMTASTGGRLDKPSSDVQWSLDGTTFAGLTTTGANVATSAAAGDYSKPLTYRLRLGWALDKPATYSVGVTYTIAAN